MMLNAGVLTFQEFAMREPLPLATVHDAVLEFLRGRTDVVVFGAMAVNAYVSEPCMTQDIDLMSSRATELAEEVGAYLRQRFHINLRVQVIGEGKGYRVSQIRTEGDRSLVRVRAMATLPPFQLVEGVPVISPPQLIALKVASYHALRGKPKAFLDWRDLAVMLLAFPELKHETGPVESSLKSLGVSEEVMNSWRQLVAEKIEESSEDEKFDSFSS
jgi:hypothetical protein